LVRCWAANLVPPAILHALLTEHVLVAVAATAAFAAGAWLLRGATAGGALAGFAVALAVFVTAGPGGFAALVSVFSVAWLTTRLGYRRKQVLGIAENERGRSAAQVLANLGAAAGFSVAAHVTGHPALLTAAMAALAEAAADTAASECGEALTERAYLITTMRPVPAGTNGGVSVPGTVAGVAAAAMIGAVATATHVVPWPALPIVIGAGVVASVIDSVLGATLEERGVIGNNGVNFASTIAAGGIALLLGKLGS
jgi:uncharacterized protein (TIGR00297 family)